MHWPKAFLLVALLHFYILSSLAQIDECSQKLTLGVRSPIWGRLSRWVWANFKLLIPSNFLALAVALAIIDSKGLFGFGSGP
jgi:hypothetical protein